MTRIIVSVPGVTFDNMLFGDGWQLGELEGWWDTTKPRIVSDARPEWHGDFGQDEVYLEPRFVTVSGVFQSLENPDLVTSARDAIAALHEAGEFEFTVSDGAVGRVTARMASELAWDVDYAPGCAAFEFTVKADDPRRYGLGQSFSTGVPTQGVGVADPVVDPVQEGGVLVPVATNLFTNPNLVGDGTWAEVARNLSIRPRPTLSGWWRQAIWFDFTVDGEWAVFTSLPAGMGRDIGGTGIAAANTHASLTAGVEYTMSMIVKPDVSGYYRINQIYRDASYASISAVPGSQVWCPAGIETPVSARGVAPAGTVYGGPRIMLGSTESLGAGVAVRARASCVTESTIYLSLDGSTKPDGLIQPEDFRVRWLGEVNASESVMEIERVRGFGLVRCIGGVSTRDGKPALRIIPTGGAAGETCFAAIVGGVPIAAREVGTFIGTFHADRESEGFSGRLNALRVGNPQQLSDFSNSAGTFERRIDIVGNDGVQAALYGDGAASTRDVWWTDIGLFAGDYAGEAFNGSTPPETIGDASYTHQWDGGIDASTSTRYWIDPGTPGNPGRVALTNTGTAPSEPMVRVTGGLSEGFELLCIETGDVVRVTRPIPDGSVIDVDMGAGQVWIDQQSPLSAMYVPFAEWFSVKPGHTCTIQFTPFGVVTGTPTMSVEFAEASW